MPILDLAQAQGYINERALALIAYEVTRLIKVCHDAGVLHGDVKPANFLIKHRQRNPLYCNDASLLRLPWLKMVDFGCSQHLEGGSARFAKRSGTPVFMAPEIFARNYGAESDMWSLGIMLYQLYTARFPYWEAKDGCKNSNLDQVAAAVTTEQPIPLEGGPWAHMSAAGKDFISSCLVKDYRQRMTVEQALEHSWFADVKASIAAAPPPVAEASLAAAAGGEVGSVPHPAPAWQGPAHVFASNNIVAAAHNAAHNGKGAAAPPAPAAAPAPSTAPLHGGYMGGVMAAGHAA